MPEVSTDEAAAAPVSPATGPADPPRPTRTSRLISASAVMAAGTALSRVLGFVRVILLAFLFANGTRQADMFAVANTVPNSMYILLAGGVLNTVLVPQLVRAIRGDTDGGEAYTNRIMTAGLIGLAAITVLLTLAVPLIIDLYTSAAWKGPGLRGQYESMVMLGYYCMPQVFFYGVHVLAGQVLNARDHFGPMMWAPIANNVVSIGVLITYALVFGQSNPSRSFTDEQELVLGLGATLGIAVQAAVLIPFLHRAGYRFRPRFDFRNAGLGHTFRLAKWTLGFVAVTQLALVVTSKLATAATTGPGGGAGLTAYFNAYLVWILPHSLITVSLATVMLSSTSRLASAGDLAGVAEETTRTIRLAVTALLPTAVGYLVLGQPIAQLAFGFGQGRRDAPLVGWALMALALGLVPFTVQYICLRAFYALENTRTPFFLQALISGANAALGISLVLLVDRPTLVAAALASAYALAYLVGVIVSFRRLRRRLPDLDAVPLLRHCVRLFVAVAPSAVVAWLVVWALSTQSATSRVALAGSLALAGVAAVGLFVVMARLLHISEVVEIIATVRRRGRSDDSDSPGGSDPGLAAPRLSIDPAAHAASATSEPTGATEDAGHMAQAAAVRDHTDGGAAPDSAGEVARPEPEAPSGSAAAVPPAAHLPAGTVLGARYRLEELITESSTTVSWRAFDQVLSRSVLIHLLAAGDPDAADLLATARQASIATDSRFLRVLDAVHSDDPQLGSYIVCEYAVGQTLELVLHQGPLSGLEAAWIVREVADALSGMHSLGLHHLRINPDTIVITPTGNIKIVGLLIESELRELPSKVVQGADTPELVDVLDLGRLLYACLVARWPGGPAFALPDAPVVGHRWATPRQVRAGVSPALDNVCDQILGDPPRHRAPAITTANGVVNALTKVLGTADAALDLERRLQQPVPKVSAGRSVPDGGPVSSGDERDQPTEAMFAVRPQVLPASVANAPRVTASVAPPAGSHRVGTGSAGPTGGAKGRSVTGKRRRPPQRWIGVLILLTALLVAAAVAAGLVLNQRMGAGPGPSTQPPSAAPSAEPPSAAPAGPLQISGAREFDPQGDPPGVEDPDGVRLAYDGDPQTGWRTVTYRGTPKLGNLKRGVGLIVDLGRPQTVRSVDLTLSGTGTAVEIRVPDGDAASVTNPPTRSDNQWTRIARDTDADASTTLRPKKPTTTRYVLVYLTSLPKEGKGYRGGIYEVSVQS